jgi:hypothetical protein
LGSFVISFLSLGGTGTDRKTIETLPSNRLTA